MGKRFGFRVPFRASSLGGVSVYVRLLDQRVQGLEVRDFRSLGFMASVSRILLGVLGSTGSSAGIRVALASMADCSDGNGETATALTCRDCTKNAGQKRLDKGSSKLSLDVEHPKQSSLQP